MRDEGNGQRDMERLPFKLDYNWSTTVFHFFVQALFAFGALQFLSIIERARRDPTSLFGGDFRLFDGKSFGDVYSTFAIILLVWIQVCANGCAHYQQHIWEARRVSVDRPNPRFRGTAIRAQYPILYGIFQAGMVLAWLVILSARLVIFLLGSSLPQWVPRHINWTVTVVLMLYLVGKILYGTIQIEAEKSANKNARSLRQIAQD
jgi:hypothetical protein